MADPNMGVLLSTTLKKHRSKLVDNIFKSHALFYTLKNDGAVKEEDGGERIVVPVMYAANSTTSSYSGYDPLDTTPQTGIDAAEYNWKQYSASITISGEEQRKNSGRKEKLIDLLEAKTKQATLSLREALVTGMYSDGTGNSSKDITGLAAMVSNSGTYGGILSTTYTWWKAYVETAVSTLDIASVRTGFNSSSIGGQDTPNIMITTQTLFEKYEALLTATISFYSERTKKLGDGGFQTLQYKGVPIVWDEQCTSGYWYFLNTNHMNLTVHKDANFETTDFVKPENQDALVAQILFMGNLTCDRRASHGVLQGATG